VANTLQTRLRLTAEDKVAIKAYWEFFEPRMKEINDQLRESLMDLPEWAPIIAAIPQAQLDKQNEEGRERQRLAAVEGQWTPYLDDLRQQGMNYAKMGVSFVAWYDIIAIYRELIRQALIPLAQTDMQRATHIGTGMNRMLDIAMSHLGEAYLAMKEKIIAEQQAAIRELSLPVLQVRDGLLIIPLIGMIDSHRARQLIETLLAAIRDKRARGVVIDVTGVPLVDTAIANTLVQVCDAAQLMGALVVITGISPDMAQTLVGLGATLPATETLVDLQEGIEFIERALGYAVATKSSVDGLKVADDVA
jgi:rsbT co-antagonist protein RsbR